MGEVIYGVVFGKPKTEAADFYAECRLTGSPPSPDKLTAADANSYVTASGDILPIEWPSDTEPPNEPA